jgi:hypothetical protein
MPEALLPAAFEWLDRPSGRYLRCRPLAAVAQHVFTTRTPELPGSPSGGSDGWAHVAEVLGAARGRVVTLTQVHGARVVSVPEDAAAARPAGTWADGDAAVTVLPDVVLAVKVADCLPILIADSRGGAVAAVHAGWRGTAAGIAAAAVRALVDRYGVSPGSLVAAIGPGIGPCCYQVGTDVADRFLEAGTRPDAMAEWFAVSPADGGAGGHGKVGASGGRLVPGRLWLDTWKANTDQLAEAGVRRSRIHVAGLCTACHSDLLHSYRVDGPRAGRMVGAIRSRSAGS